MGNLTGYLTSAVLLVLGIIICFRGYRLFKFSVTVAGAILGYQAGTIMINLINRAGGLDTRGVAKTVVPLALAVICGALAFSFYRKAFIFVVAAMVTRIMYRAMKSASFAKNFDAKQTIIVLAISVVVGIAIGMACFLIQKGAIIFVSGFGGASLIESALLKYILMVPFISDAASRFTTKIFSSNITPVNAISGLLVLSFGIAGIIVQTKKRA